MHKILQSLLLLSLFFSSLINAADETYWLEPAFVKRYVHNSEMQRRWAISFLAPHLKQLKGDEAILDIGCGDGKISADLSRFVPQGRITGIDPSPTMLSWALKQYSSSDYPNVQFSSGGFLEPNLTGQYDLIVSNCALQHCPDHLQALMNVSSLLKPGGKVCILTPSLGNGALNTARKIVQSRPQWASYWQEVRPRKMYMLNEYPVMMQLAGLTPLRIEKIPTVDVFVDRDELIEFFLGTFTPVVPLELAHDYYNELVDQYLLLLPEAQRPDGAIELRLHRIEIEALKK